MAGVGNREAARKKDSDSGHDHAIKRRRGASRSWWRSASSRFAKIVGRERVIAGADCGFSSFAGSLEIHPTIVWAKLQSLVEGARLATKQLWAKN